VSCTQLAAQCSEDALVIWVASGVFNGRYGGSLAANLGVLLIVWLGVTVSDMLTFCIGVLLREGVFKRLKSDFFFR
jgi:membrane protein DedA with SNARE-associated domain